MQLTALSNRADNGYFGQCMVVWLKITQMLGINKKKERNRAEPFGIFHENGLKVKYPNFNAADIHRLL